MRARSSSPRGPHDAGLSSSGADVRAPVWETSAGALAALLNSGAPLNKADLYTLTLAGGTVLRWSGHDTALTANSLTWSLGPGIRRSRLRFRAGVSVDTLTLQLTDNLATTIAGVPLVKYIASGGLYGARLQLHRAFWGIGQTSPVGYIEWFEGRMADVPQVNRYEAQLLFKSDLELLDVMVPREVYQGPCLNTVYDPRCGASKATFTQTGNASGAGSADRTTFNHGFGSAPGNTAGYHDLGVVTFTSGPNTGISRTVKKHTGTQVIVTPPWPFQVANGNAFSIRPGCNKSQTDANGCLKFFGTAAVVAVHFRGFPYIPAPETVL